MNTMSTKYVTSIILKQAVVRAMTSSTMRCTHGIRCVKDRSPYLVPFLFMVWLPTLSSQGTKDAVFVARTTDLSGSQNPVKFDNKAVDTKGSFDQNAGRFYAKQDGIYWASFSAGALPRKYVTPYLAKNDVRYCGVWRHADYHNGEDTMSRDIIVPMKATQELHVENSLHQDGLYSSSGLETSLSLFCLTGLMNKTIAFSAARYSQYTSTDNVLRFTDVLVNEGSAFNLNSSSFEAPMDGLYFLSYSVGVFPSIMFRSVLRTAKSPLATLERVSTNHNSFDTISRSGLFKLSKGDTVHISINKTVKVNSVEQVKHTSFSGFYYKPVEGKSVAWSVAKTSSWSGNVSLNPIPFDEVLINEGGAWANNVFTCTTQGIYYVTVSVGAQEAERVSVSLMVNGKMKVKVTRNSTSHNGMDMLGRSAILFLNTNDKVHLEAAPYTSIFSNTGRHTAFSGFLLFPHDKPK